MAAKLFSAILPRGSAVKDEFVVRTKDHDLHAVVSDDLPFWPYSADESYPQPQQSRQRTSLLDLPTELLSAITSWIMRPKDLARMCLVSRRFHELGMTQLYRTIHVNVDRWTTDHQELITTNGHPGHQYIRSLDIDSSRLKSGPQVLEVANKLLNCVKQDQLQSFRCPLESGVDMITVISLFDTQTKLRYVALGPFLDTFLHMEHIWLWSDHVNNIVVPWKLLGEQDVKFYQSLIERRDGNLKALTVRAHDYTSRPHPAMGDDSLANGLFSHLVPYQGSRQLKLPELNLQNQDLSRCEETWLRFVDFSQLHILQIWNCDAVDALLKGMQKLARKKAMELYGLVLSCEEKGQAPKLAAKYIASTSGLRYLNVWYVPAVAADGRADFDIKCLQPHSETLNDLFVGIGSNHQEKPDLYVPSLDEFEWLSREFKQLRQIAIPLPNCAVGCETCNNPLAGEWGNYGIALTKLAALPRLKVLRILTWPQTCHLARNFNNGAMQAHRTHYLKNLDIVAISIARLFSQLRGDDCDRLSVITFGHAEWPSFTIYVDGLRETIVEQPITYKIRRFMTEFGLRTKVERIDVGKMEQEEPIGFVVDEDTDQGLNLAAYS